MSGLLLALPLLASAVGGVLFGWLADRFGRTRALMASILVYSVATAACGLVGIRLATGGGAPARGPGDGRRVGHRRGAGGRDLASGAPGQGARPDAKRLGRGLRGGRRAQCRGSADVWLARGVSGGPAAGARHAVDSPFGSGVAAVAGRSSHGRALRAGRRAHRARRPAHVDGRGDERRDDVRVVGPVLVDPVVSGPADRSGRSRAVVAALVDVDRADAGRHVARLRQLRLHRRPRRDANART